MKNNAHKRLCYSMGPITDRAVTRSWKALCKRDTNRKLRHLPIPLNLEVTSKWSDNWLNPDSLVFFPEEIAFPVDREKPQPMAYAMGRFVNRYQPTVKVHSHA